MLIKANMPVALFLFAHQDDEFGVFAKIEEELRAGRCVRCVFVTDGATNASPEVRDAESLAVLQKLGVSKNDLIFLGRQLKIGDGQLYQHVDVFAQWLNDFVNLHQKLDVCFVPAWEGGHPDHDLVHATAVELLSQKDFVGRILQYPLYHGRNCFGPFFRLLSPLPENGPTSKTPISWRDRLRYLRLCLSYPSQWRTWIGLFPFACVHYLGRGVQYLQNVDQARLYQPPHARPLYYERRGFLEWPTLFLAIKKLIEEKPFKSYGSESNLSDIS